MNTKLILIGVIGLGVVLYLIKKLQPGETNVVSQLVPVGSIDNNSGVDSRVAFETNKTAAFASLLNLGETTQQAKVALANIEASEKLGQAQTANEGKAAEYGYYATIKGFDRDVAVTELSNKTQLETTKLLTESELQQNRDYLDSVLKQLNLQNQFKIDLTREQTENLNRVAYDFRNQSLERQGTILNSLNSLYTGQAPYSYQSSFGGSRPPTLLQQITGLVSQLTNPLTALFPKGI